MNDSIRTCRVLVLCGVIHAITFGFTAVAAANDPGRFEPHTPAVNVADTTQRPTTWRHS